jgi:putative transposase
MTFPPHQTVYKYFQKWQRKGIWQAIHDELRGEVREDLGREANSSIAIADSQSVKTTEKRGRSTVLMAARRLRAVSAIS